QAEGTRQAQGREGRAQEEPPLANRLAPAGAIGIVAATAAPYGGGMARDTLPISCGVVEYLQRAGLPVPAAAGEVTTDEYFDFWRAIAAADDRADLGLAIGLAVLGRSVS